MKLQPYVGTGKDLKEDEVMDFENRAYNMLHRANSEWPCMTLDWLVPLNNSTSNYIGRTFEQESWEFPLKVYAVAGSTASMPSKNQLYVLKFARLLKTKYDDDSIEMEGDEESVDDEPLIFHTAT